MTKYQCWELRYNLDDLKILNLGCKNVVFIPGLLLYIIIFFQNTPRTAGGPGGRDRMLAVKSRKTLEN